MRPPAARALQVKFGRHIRWLRRSRGLTQLGLADRALLSLDSVSRIERGRFAPSLDTIHKLARGLGTSVGHVFASLHQESRDDLAGIAEYLHDRSRAEVRLVQRVLHSLFDPPDHQQRARS